MHIYIKNKQSVRFTIFRDVESINITKDIAIVHIQDIYEDKVIDDKLFYCNPKNIQDTINQSTISFDCDYTHLVFMKKEFLDVYSTHSEPQDLAFFRDTYGVDIKAVWDMVHNGSFDIEEYVQVEMSYYDNTIYPFVYGSTMQGWFPHMVPYSWGCYMLTDAEYNLPDVLEFLLEEESKGTIALRRGSYGVWGSGSCVIRSIPVYNRCSDDETEYINFLCRVDTAGEFETIKSDVSKTGLRINPKWEKLLEPYKN